MAETDLDRELDDLVQQIRRMLSREYARGASDMRARLINALDMSLPDDAALAATKQTPKADRPRKARRRRTSRLAELITQTYTDASGREYGHVIAAIRARGGNALDASIRNEMRRMVQRGEMRREGDLFFLVSKENGHAPEGLDDSDDETRDENASPEPPGEARFDLATAVE